MVESADYLCEKHFGRNLIDKDVEILDPAAGTGTFICEMLEHFRGQPAKLKHKYLEELHANEVAILPYYVANLNIEATYAAISGEYEEYPNLCFVDTLDNTYALRKYRGHMDDLFGSLSDDNVRRIRRQNSRKISVIIGNPPYNANQLNENEDNKNREYPEIDKRIKETYIAASTAQKTKLYDMYARFLRWASDRVDENGIIAFVSNNSFIDSRTFDGFRKVVCNEFNEVWIVDLKGNARTSGERRRREAGNVFDDQIRVGVAVYFLVRKRNANGCRIFYEAVRDFAKGDEKRDLLRAKPIQAREWEEIRPDAKYNWLNVARNDFNVMIPIATKAEKMHSQTKSVFSLFSQRVKTNRDDWVWDFSRDRVLERVQYLVEVYASHLKTLPPDVSADQVPQYVGTKIKWTRKLKNLLIARKAIILDPKRAVAALYRPFTRKWLYFAWELNEDWYQLNQLFIPGRSCAAIVFTDTSPRAPFGVLACDGPFEHHLAASSDSFQCVGLYRFGKQGDAVENVTDWALGTFRQQYAAGNGRKNRAISKQAIFHYVYGVLHDPVYREKYAINLKREFPRVPFYKDFWQWAEWGKALMDLHIGYESVTPAKLDRIDLPDEKARQAGLSPKCILKADKKGGRIIVDSETTLTGVPPKAWEYRLGNRSALEWILDQYKEKKPKDPTIREKFNTYRFADYKEKVIDLIMRVTTVSVRTVAMVEAMSKVGR